jgi:[acyl-carrier-protein] S-malonyltransferase
MVFSHMGVAVMFPGQGAQAVGMGQRWKGTPSWAVLERAEEALGAPLAALVLDDPVDRTREAQLGVLLTSLMAWDACKEAVGQPVAFSGHSLGQVTALIAAGVLPFEAGIRFAAQRADATQAAADAAPGRMAALLGGTDDQIAAAISVDGCWVANDNAPGQLVVAGTPDGLEAGVAAAKAAGLRKAMALNVGGAFHTPLMAAAVDALRPILAELDLRDAAVPVVSNGDATAYTDGEGWRIRLADHLVNPVRWRQTLEALVALGATSLLEVGPGEALAGMARRTVPDTRAGSPELILEVV